MESILLNLLMIFVCIFFIFLNQKKKTPYLNIIQVQNIVWLIAFVIYIFKIIDYYSFKTEVYLFVFEYLCAINFTFLANKKNKRSFIDSPNIEHIKESISDKWKVKKCIIASLLCWFSSISILRKSIPILFGNSASVGMNLLRYQVYGATSIYSTIEMCLIDFVIKPVFMVTIIFMAIQVAYRRINFKLLTISVLDALMLVLITAGRTMMVSLVFYVVFAVIAVNGTNLFRLLKRYRRYVLLFVAVITVFVIISNNRVNRGEGIFYEIILYYFSGIPFFSGLLSSKAAIPMVLYGTGTFSPVYDSIILILRFLGVGITGASQYIANLTNAGVSVGPNVATNATASTLLVFYLDFGWIGPLVSGVVLGILVRIAIKKLDKNNVYSFAIYLYILVGMATSIQNYSFLGVTPMAVILFMGILLRDKRRIQFLGVKFK